MKTLIGLVLLAIAGRVLARAVIQEVRRQDQLIEDLKAMQFQVDSSRQEFLKTIR